MENGKWRLETGEWVRERPGDMRWGHKGKQIMDLSIGDQKEAVVLKVASVSRFFLHTSSIISYSYSCLV